jgi:predicted phosphodiesterase/RNA-binding protein YhbY
MNKDKIFGVVISDIHIGIKNTKKLFQELNDVFIPFIKDHSEKIDIIHLNGDYFHKKIHLNEYSSKIAISFFDEIVNICEKNNIKLRVIKGTLTHDNDQLDNFLHYYNNDNLDIKIMKKVELIEEYDNVNILYVPEEYVEDQHEYYKEFREKNPNIIMGHGTWDFVAFDNQIIESEMPDKSSPIFIYEDWKDNFDFAVFGHIHGRQKYKNKIWYPGSFSRWAHGEEKSKGFITYEYDVKEKTYNVNFIDNDKAPEYTSINLSRLGEDINQLNIEDILDLANTALTESDTIRLDLEGLTEDKLVLIKKALASNDNVKIKVKSQRNEDNTDKFKKYMYIINRELSLPETLVRFAKEEYDVDITLEVVEEAIRPINKEE